ncbi:MAG: class I SAM-dependent methyltransferase [Planctomycetes bacterium]|nr:class I SAM-dependent methyltransferase [Planctomycetota bacterium]
MDEAACRQFRDPESAHWWFQGRRAIFCRVLDRFLLPAPGGPAPGGTRAPLLLLDLGCSAGAMLGRLARYGRVIGLDPEPGSLRHCRARGLVDVSLGNAYHLPFGAATFDGVTLFDSLEHIDDDRAVLGEVARVLRPGGLVMVTVPAYPFLFSDNDVAAGHRRRYTAGMLKRRLRAAGLPPVKTSYYNTILFPLIVPVVLLKKAKTQLCGRAGPPRSNVSYALPRPLNAALAAVFRAERFPLSRLSFPLGHSLLCVSRKVGS